MRFQLPNPKYYPALSAALGLVGFSLLAWGWFGPWETTAAPAAAAPTPLMVAARSVQLEPDIISILPSPTVQPSATPTATSTPAPTATSTVTATPTAEPTATTAATLAPTPTAVLATATLEPTPTPGEPTATATAAPAPQLAAGHPAVPPAVLANYLPWYDPGTWATGCTSAGDQPAAGVYNSDDAGVIGRHIGEARAAALDGFAVHWFAPGNRTDTNFASILAQSPDGFNSAVTYLYHILPGVNESGVIDSLNYVINTYGGNARYYRIDGKPVIIFSDLARVPGPGGGRDSASAVARWQEIRNTVDPNHNSWWIGEGLDPSYLSVFDGLYVYKIDHACCPGAMAGAGKWARSVRQWETQTGQPKLWVGTVMPGWNDANSAGSQCSDLRVSSQPFARDRAGGAYYDNTWNAVLPTAPDFIILHSFNEWVEGSYIEPSAIYGDLYLQLTAQHIAAFKSSR